MASKKPQVIDEYLYAEGITAASSVLVGSESWFKWLEWTECKQFGFKHSSSSFTARLEPRKDGSYWYAYKRVSGRLRKLYIGKTEDLTSKKLNDVCFAINVGDTEFWAERAQQSQQEKSPNSCVTSTNSSSIEDRIETIKNKLLADETVTRHGKDRGSVRRALDAFISELAAGTNSG